MSEVKVAGDDHDRREAVVQSADVMNDTSSLSSPPSPSPSPPFPRYYNSSTWKLVSQGAEARIWIISNFFSTKTKAAAFGSSAVEERRSSNGGSTSTSSRDVICKERFYKSYRHPQLNQNLTKSRVRAEVRCITKARKHSIKVPLILGVDLQALAPSSNNTNQQSMCIFMEYFVNHITVKQYLNQHLPKHHGNVEEEEDDDDSDDVQEPSSKKARKDTNLQLNENLLRMACAMATVVAKLHNCNVTHGDLTTSNMLFNEKLEEEKSHSYTDMGGDNTATKSTTKKNSVFDDNSIVLIDFGLGQMGTTNPEDKAVDLYVMERALISSHPGPYTQLLWDEILRMYKKVNTTSDSVLSRLNQVRQRGRKRECFG